MINIETYPVPKKDSTSNEGGGSTTVVQNNSLADSWFFYNNDYDAVCCRYNFYSVGSVSANGGPPEEETGRDDIVDNLDSYDTNKALSANQGRVLKELINNIPTSGDGQAMNTVDWSNITNKPNSFTPSAHTHAIGDITGLQNTITTQNNNINTIQGNLNSHTGDTNIHLSSSQRNKLNTLTEQQLVKLGQLIDLITIDTSSNTITLNGTMRTVNDVTAHV